MSDVDYGYGSDGEDYGYGDTSPDEDYGYGDAAPEEAAPKVETRPKRRCSVTKFNLDNNDALTAADRIRDFRSNAMESKSEDGFQTDDMSSDEADEPDEPVEQSSSKKKSSKKVGKGALSRLRKRLSVAF